MNPLYLSLSLLLHTTSGHLRNNLDTDHQVVIPPLNDTAHVLPAVIHHLKSSSGLYDFTNLSAAKLLVKGAYKPSGFEAAWAEHSADASWMDNPCDKLDQFKKEVKTWLGTAERPSDSAVFSQMPAMGGSENATTVEWIEPLAFMLRHPRATCGTDIMDKSWLVLASSDMARTKTGKRKLFDAGAGPGYASSLKWFVDEYQKRGVSIDEIFSWEITDTQWNDVPQDMKAKVHHFAGVPVDNRPDSENNPVARLAKECNEEDFCVLKLDIDTPPLENSLLQQLLDGSAERSKVDEFFFEEHVHGRMQAFGWGKTNVEGNWSDTYEALRRLRESGIRAHSWV